jgi:alpha-D-ribose 1-methylphosphonate 5-triphosphate synthase subunit PhnH
MTSLLLEPVWTAAAQARLYRAVLAAHAFPGEVVDCRAWLGGRPAAVGVLAALADGAVTLADLHGLLDPRDLGLIAAAMAPVSAAAFVVASGATAPSEDLRLEKGEILAPERGATLILVCQAVGEGALRLALSGPGIDGSARLAVAGLDPAWMALRATHNRRPPLGIDLVLCDGARVAALPRTTAVEVL